MITRRISEPSVELQRFLDESTLRGFDNNATLDAMKWDWCLENGGAWYATYRADDSIVSVSGIHPFSDGYRALFRGAQLEPRPIGINKYHMQSHCFHSQLPLQIAFAKHYMPIYITTNVDNDASGMMTRINRTFMLLETLGLVEHKELTKLGNTLQNVWQLDVEKYLSIRAKF